MMFTLYGIPNCDTVKKAMNWLKENQITFTFNDYKKNGISQAKLEEWLTQYPWESLINRNGTTWKQTPDDQKPTDATSAVLFMMTNTSAIRRPIIEAECIVALGFDAKYYEKAFGISV